MEALIESLLHYSQIGRVEPAIEDIDMQEVVDETLELLAARLQEGQAQVRLPARLPTVRADRVQVEIFANLIANAIKYNDKVEKWVEIGCEVSPDVDGAMRPSSTLGTTVSALRRSITSRSSVSSGGCTGVRNTGAARGGADDCTQNVERHGGHIWLVSQPDAGTTFHFTLEGSREGVHAHDAGYFAG